VARLGREAPPAGRQAAPRFSGARGPAGRRRPAWPPRCAGRPDRGARPASAGRPGCRSIDGPRPRRRAGTRRAEVLAPAVLRWNKLRWRSWAPKMAEHVGSVLCGKQVIDPQANLMSLLDVMEQLYIVQGEERLAAAKAENKSGILFEQPTQLVTYWYRSDVGVPETSTGRAALKDPSGKELQATLFDIHHKHKLGGFRFIVRLSYLPVTSFGLYWFIVEQWRRKPRSKTEGWVLETRIPFNILSKAGQLPEDF
jgi:hypothetical protein